MPVLRLPRTTLPSPARPDWIDFLTWLTVERDYTGPQVVYVVEKPHKHADIYAEYLATGGLNR